MANAVELAGICKSFPNVRANRDVTLAVRQGEIHALIGENGAGKSTLVNILFGLLRPDSGTIRIFDKEVILGSPKRSIELGLGMVHQHFKLVPSLSVTENIFLGGEITRRGLIDRHAQVEKVKELSKKFGLEVDPAAKVRDLSVGIQQRVEILKVLYRGAKILIMDEPTAVLTPQETRELFGTLRDFVNKQGMTIIFITHRLEEVMEVSDNVTVLRQGEVVARRRTAETAKEELAALMVGRELVSARNDRPSNPGQAVLEVSNLWCRDDLGLPALRGIDFEVRSGEIVGIAGVAGNGQTELAEVISGLRKSSFGEVHLQGCSIGNLTPRQIRKLGMCHVPGDRLARGVDKDNSIERNILMGRQSSHPWAKRGWLRRAELRGLTERLMKEYDIRAAGGEVTVKTLSGGNIQKVVVAREFSQDSGFMLVDQPTRGIDIGSSNSIHQEILRKRDAGKAVLLISVQLDEVLSLSDRVLVMFGGRIVGEVDPKTTSEEEIGLLMAGITGNKQRVEGGSRQ